MTDWYKLPHKIILGLILIILRSRIVTKITAGKIFHMSIQTFGVVSIMKIINITFNKIKIFSIFFIAKNIAKSNIKLHNFILNI